MMETQTQSPRQNSVWDYHGELTGVEARRFGILYDTLTGELRKQVPDLSGKRVLDVGCGTGQMMLRLQKHGAAVEGADVNPKKHTGRQSQGVACS
jgi:2-polyprenyl-3-methyl-5-hydroxy-6-metoxy-1,4-benzoquinol methylase